MARRSWRLQSRSSSPATLRLDLLVFALHWVRQVGRPMWRYQLDRRTLVPAILTAKVCAGHLKAGIARTAAEAKIVRDAPDPIDR